MWGAGVSSFVWGAGVSSFVWGAGISSFVWGAGISSHLDQRRSSMYFHANITQIIEYALLRRKQWLLLFTYVVYN